MRYLIAIFTTILLLATINGDSSAMLANRMLIGAAGVAGGGNDSYTVLLGHMDGTDDAQVFTDSGAGPNCPHTMTANGNVKTENTQKKFGITSAYFDGTGDYIQIADSTDWDIIANTDNATVDFWVKHDDHVGSEGYVSQRNASANQWWISHEHGSGIRFNSDWVDSGWVAGGEITDTDWHHIALVKDGTTYNLYLDGTSIWNTTDLDTGTITDGPLYIGCVIPGLYEFAGYIDELRISKGIARWTANFTPPTAAYYE